uniref:IST1 homolog n=1 Tax=Chlamydomonas leiostraca TaxID=1034604 RepID=A0A7S0RFP5_9CHLO|mmetsp:Transcript_21492/g.54709  ORF Transcript_21492/g.54709 Transcript_21492/m.54709 type:complete len:434 (+) Transcript_21492:91-1392(+)|eukprot:CAMPEP_0202859782 /NCGR_PEP_ID=MMETSP1391-20130828/1754_1 /ASSEMBLY_ACC=CAM_ASM_000867 /TAXON_ID=1034604 /ORGANISM="Chlamydomonas leiostraca, Strain SAG 11-49" /LENGTH=433 /DNA_ID=CAMNT_0049538859 /DNA_START=91 /DNA_END=1392 /DNA_ORIENTATION=-
MFGGFNIAKSETQCRLCKARINLQRNKRTIAVKTMRKEIAGLLASGKQEYARIRVEGVIRENLLMQAYEILELYLELIAVRSQLIAKTKEIPRDMVEAISSIIYAAQRISDVPELTQLRALFASKYGKEYANEAASDVTCAKWQVNANLIRCLLVEPPQPEEKLAMLSEIAQEQGVEWDLATAARDLLPQGAHPGAAVPAPPGPGLATQGGAGAAAAPMPPPGMMPPPGGMSMDPQQAAAAAAAAAAHARAMADYAAQLAMQQQVNSGAMPPPSGVPPAGWLVANTPGGDAVQAGGASSSSAGGGAGPSQPTYVRVVEPPAGGFVPRSEAEIQRAYDAAVGPPAKGALSPPTAPAPPVMPPHGHHHSQGSSSLEGLPTPPLDLPRAPQELPRPPAAVVPGTFDLPHPPTGSIPAGPEDEYDELSRRLDALKRS